MASIISGIMIPIIMIYYAKKEFERLVKMLKMGIKIISIVIAIPIGIICAFSENILNIWIGNEFIYLNTLLILSLVPLIISVSITPLFSVNISYNKVKFPGIVSLIFGTISILLSIYLIIYTDLKLYSVVIASGIMLAIKNGIVIPIYTAHIMKIKSTSFIFYPTIGLIYFIIIFFIGNLLNNYVIYSSLISLFLMMSITGVISLLFLFLYSLKDQDIKFIINKIISRKKRKNNEEE
jgi:O-antigen/teichoic acid export membrane protein